MDSKHSKNTGIKICTNFYEIEKKGYQKAKNTRKIKQKFLWMCKKNDILHFEENFKLKKIKSSSFFRKVWLGAQLHQVGLN